MLFIKLLNERGNAVRQLNIAELVEIEPVTDSKTRLYFTGGTTATGGVFMTTPGELEWFIRKQRAGDGSFYTSEAVEELLKDEALKKKGT